MNMYMQAGSVMYSRSCPRYGHAKTSPNSSVLAVGLDPSLVKFYRIETGEVLAQFGLPFIEMQRTYRSLAFSPDGAILATGDINGAIRFYGVKKESRQNS
jgi:WD40 repeat protein